MLNFIVLILITILLIERLNIIINRSLKKSKNNYASFKNDSDKLIQKNTEIEKVNADLKNTLEQTITLYDITKLICKTLDRDTVFNSFNEQMRKYIEVKDCQFIQEDIDPSQYKEYIILPLKIDRESLGYLVADGIKELDREKFHILSEQFTLGLKRAFFYQKVQGLAIMDSLTGVFSRRYWLERLNEELVRSKKFNYHFSFLMLDIDHFKEFNDHYGHLVGDVILKEVTKTVKENLRQIDLIGRYGGEEFSIILIETGKDDASFVAERIRKAIEDKPIRAYDEDLRITASIGIACFPDDAQEREALIERADQALYLAKQSGRNRICIYKK